MDIAEVILNDHHDQRRMFAILEEIHSSDTEALTSIWTRLKILLEVHAKAEEVLFYPQLLRLQQDVIAKESPEEETTDAIHDHNEIRDPIAGLDAQVVGSDAWHRALAKVNEVNGDHMAEEERQGLTDVRRHMGVGIRHELAVRFYAFEATHAGGIEPEDLNPARYVTEHKDGA